MASHCTVNHSSFHPPLRFLKNSFRPQKFTYPFRSKPSISCQSYDSSHDDGNKDKNSRLELLKLTVTLTVISTSLPQPSLAAKVVEKKRAAKKTEAMTVEQLKSFSQGLPVVKDRIPYTDLLSLREEGKLKHVIKQPNAALSRRAEWVLVVLDDSRVLRTVLPSVGGNSRFWSRWQELKIDEVCVNAYNPPISKPEVPFSYTLLFFKGMFSGVKPEPESKEALELKMIKPKPQSKRALELKRMRKELKKGQKKEELVRMRREMEEMEEMEEELRMKKRREERKRKREERKIRYEQSLRRAWYTYLPTQTVNWRKLAKNQHVITAIGFVILYIFYVTVVLTYKRQKKDYEDRLKIQKAEAEERKKMRELENQMLGLDGPDDEEEGKGGSEDTPYLKMAKQFMKSGARVQLARNRRLPQYLDRDVDVKFSDVAGLGKIRLELEEIVKFFTHAEMYRRRGVRIPGGILLCGPPGVGKTLLAKAVAGEAGVNFFSISASQFVEIYVGVGASRVRALYQEARANAPAVVFIDELDAVGRERGLIKGSGGQERDATLNQLLISLDGFEGRGNVITIASTNRPDILDPALVRPGRFDRKIYIPKPSLIGRIEILKVHTLKKPMAEDVDYVAVASMAEGMVGAELANVVEVAAINMLRDGRTEITTDDLLQAAQMEERGMLERKERSPEMWRRIALNEAAQAVAAINFRDLRNVEFITISPRAGRELGYVRMRIDHVKFKEGMLSRQSVLDHITVQLAPRAADEIWHGEDQLSTIWAETANNARSAARTFVLGGLSEKNHGLSSFRTAERINDIDLEALRILNICYECAKEILRRNRKLMDAVVDELVQKKSLTKEEFFHLVDIHGSLEPIPPSIIDIRAKKYKEFQDNMMKRKDEALTSNM